jgi:hypothetical protein
MEYFAIVFPPNNKFPVCRLKINLNLLLIDKIH